VSKERVDAKGGSTTTTEKRGSPHEQLREIELCSDPCVEGARICEVGTVWMVDVANSQKAGKRARTKHVT
jgi:hypothetical protein